MLTDIKYIIILILCCAGLLSYGQNPRHQDSLATHRYHQLYNSSIYSDREMAKQALDSLKTVSVRNNYPAATYFYHQNSGDDYFKLSKLTVSESHYKHALKIAEDLKLPYKIVDSKNWLGNHKYFQRDYKGASILFNEILSLSEEIAYTEGIGLAYFGLAAIERNEGKILELLIKIDSVYTEKNVISPVLANSYEKIGDIYLNSYNKKEIAVEYFKKSLAISERINYPYGVDQINKLLGEMAIKDGDYELASHYFHNLYKESLKRKDTLGQIRRSTLLATVDIELGNWDDAKERGLTAINYYEKIQDSLALSEAHLFMARLYNTMGSPEKAKPYLDYATEHPVSIDTLGFQVKLLKESVDYLALTNNYKGALTKQQELDSIKALQLIQRNEKVFLTLEQEFRTHQKEQQIALLESEKNLMAQKKNNQLYMLIGGIVFITLMGILLFILYRNKQKTNRKLTAIDQLKNDFFTNISHELRTPLTLISTPLQNVLNSDGISSDDKKALEVALQNNRRLTKLVDQLLNLSKIDAGSLRLQVEEDLPLRHIRSLVSSYSYLAQNKQLKYSSFIPDDKCKAWFDKDFFDKIIGNLLSNAIKYTPEKGSVNCQAFIEDDVITVKISNTGNDFDQLDKEKLFNRFYRENTQETGTGIGLALVKELVVLHKGGITVNTYIDSCITFSLNIPVGRKYFSQENLKQVGSKTCVPSIDQFIPEDLDDKVIALSNSFSLPILLIVEDNKDIRAILSETFKKEYHILMAENGDEGIKIALKNIPDIIISDVMMPVKNGIELTKTLKNDQRTSHIPIILLTAKTGDENELEAMNVKADEYITKPYNTKLLTSKVDRLIALRKQLQEHFSQQILLRPKNITISSLDEKFLEKVQNILDEKLISPLFTIKELHRTIGMSRMQLHRKLKALTGLSTSEFIREQRLKLASNLLKESDCNISEIGYAVGFNDPAYFTKCFKEYYKCTPTEFVEKSNK